MQAPELGHLGTQATATATATSTATATATAKRTAKRQQVQIRKITTLHVFHAFLYISFPSQYDFGLRRECAFNFKLCEDVRQRLSFFS